MLKQLRNWKDRYRPLKDDHFISKSILNADYQRIDNDPEFRERWSAVLGGFRLGGIFAKVVDHGTGLFVTLRLYYHGDPYRTECLYRFEWGFGTEQKYDELFGTKFGSEIFGCDPNHVQEEFDSMKGSIMTTIAIHRVKMHTDISVPVEPSTATEEELAQRWDRWHENWHTR